MTTVGILPLARPTFDVPYAEATLEAALRTLDESGHVVVGARRLLFDAEETRAALAELKDRSLDLAIILQATFTDASMTVEIAETLDAPLAIWAFPEPRSGGRLRLNSFCGLNLAAHALGLRGHDFAYLYMAPDVPEAVAAAGELLTGARRAPPPVLRNPDPDEAGAAVARSLRGVRIGVIGEHPTGFDTCAYDAAAVEALAGVGPERIALGAFFERGTSVPDEKAEEVRTQADRDLVGLADVDQAELDRSLRLKAAFEELRGEGGFDAFAVRCWPECFTEYGGAACGPVSMMGEARVPCACEADVYGALTALIVQRVADAPAFLVDLVDLDAEDDTGVVWHCGQAPVSMADPDAAPRATVHTNRRQPLLYEFPLKAGRVTLARVSQAAGEPKLVIATGEMLKRPMAFTGTSGVLRFDARAGTVLDRLIGARLEHHTALAYGDFAPALQGVAAELGLPVLDLSA